MGLGILVWDTTYHLDPYKPIDSAVKPINIEAVSPGLEMAVYLSGPEYRRRQSARFPCQCSAEFQDHIGHGHDILFHPAAGQPDLRHGRHADPAASHGR
jgi:hypothetical protein